eukprot:11160131-Lingulodinium_polyedra.AAC.1
MQSHLERFWADFEFGASARSRRAFPPLVGIMDYVRSTLDCLPDADVFRSLDSAGALDCAFLDLQNRWGSPTAPVYD